jgi:hypothetical protein
MVFTEDFPDYTRAFPKWSVGGQAEFVHCVQNAAVDWFQSISGIGKCPSDDYAHRVF